MKEIKFRGKALDGKWIYGAYLPAMDDDSCDSIINSDYPSGRIVKTDSVGQYTGLKDKNNKEIYEGDIIECISSDNKPIRHLVRYNDEKGGYSQLLFMGNDLACEPYDGGLISQNYICEMGKYIIGNIHDNPELLK